MHKGTDTVLHGQHGKGGMVTLERQDRVRRDSYSSPLSGLLCCKRGSCFLDASDIGQALRVLP